MSFRFAIWRSMFRGRVVIISTDELLGWWVLFEFRYSRIDNGLGWASWTLWDRWARHVSVIYCHWTRKVRTVAKEVFSIGFRFVSQFLVFSQKRIFFLLISFKSFLNFIFGTYEVIFFKTPSSTLFFEFKNEIWSSGFSVFGLCISFLNFLFPDFFLFFNRLLVVKQLSVSINFKILKFLFKSSLRVSKFSHFLLKTTMLTKFASCLKL